MTGTAMTGTAATGSSATATAMTGPSPTGSSATATAMTGSSATGSSVTGRWWKPLVIPVTIGLVILISALFVALNNHADQHGVLDPTSADPAGARALATLLNHHGIAVERVTEPAEALRRTTAAPSSVTLVIPQPDLVAPRSLHRLAELPGAARVVLVEADELVLEDLGNPVELRSQVVAPVVEPNCELPIAEVAGDAKLDGAFGYRLRAAGTTCYRSALAVVRPAHGPTMTFLGSSTPLTNGALSHRGNAALSLGLLSETPRVVWLSQTFPEAGTEEEAADPLSLLPAWVEPAAVQLALVAVLAALWRGRRLGRPVAEPLPVIVRSAETAEGRARLYRRSRSRDRAIAALRGGALSRLLPALGLGRDPDRRVLVTTISDRSGHPAAEIDTLLFGPVPGSDRQLVTAADDLDQLVADTLARPSQDIASEQDIVGERNNASERNSAGDTVPPRVVHSPGVRPPERPSHDVNGKGSPQ
jgi:hypothetical protein